MRRSLLVERAKRTLTAATTILGQRDQRHIGTANRRHRQTVR